MASLEFIQIGEDRYCTIEHLQTAFEDGIVEEAYISSIRSMMRKEAVKEVASGIMASIRRATKKKAKHYDHIVRAYFYDKIHGTSYCYTYRRLAAEARDQRFEKSIDLTRVTA